MKRRDFMLGSIVSAALAACGVGLKFSPEMVTPFEGRFRFPLMQAPGRFALEACALLAKDKEITPIIIGESKSLLYISEGLELSDQGPPEDILKNAADLNFPDELTAQKIEEFKQFQESMKDNPAYEGLLGSLEMDENVLPSVDDILADWPGGHPSKSKQKLPGVLINYSTERPFDSVVIALVPADNAAEVPAYMEFGGYNDCPGPAWHVAALKYFEAQYGARLVGLSHDTLDVIISKKPTTKEAAAKAALMLYVYCPDLVEQGTGSISALAKELMVHDRWTLWWD